MDLTVPRGSPATLHCVAAGSPEPTITWLREDGGPVTPEGDHTVQLPDGSLFFLRTVQNPRSQDSGLYSCRAENRDGVVQSRPARLTVTCKYSSLFFVLVLMIKNWKKFTAEKTTKFYIRIQKLQFNYPKASIKDVQVTKEAFGSQKRTYMIQHLKTWNFFNIFFFCGSFLPSWIRIRIPNTDPDPLTRLNPDPIGIRVRNPASKSQTLSDLPFAFSLLESFTAYGTVRSQYLFFLLARVVNPDQDFLKSPFLGSE